MTTTTTTVTVIGGVDTHKHTHYAAAIDDHRRLLGHQEFAATDRGYRVLLVWLRTIERCSRSGSRAPALWGRP